jgi:hypothetical protein
VPIPYVGELVEVKRAESRGEPQSWVSAVVLAIDAAADSYIVIYKRNGAFEKNEVVKNRIRAAGSGPREGDKVEARCKGSGKHYSGKVAADNGDGTFDVKFDDGDRDTNVMKEDIKMLGGTGVPAPTRGGGKGRDDTDRSDSDDDSRRVRTRGRSDRDDDSRRARTRRRSDSDTESDSDDSSRKARTREGGDSDSSSDTDPDSPSSISTCVPNQIAATLAHLKDVLQNDAPQRPAVWRAMESLELLILKPQTGGAGSKETMATESRRPPLPGKFEVQIDQLKKTLQVLHAERKAGTRRRRGKDVSTKIIECEQHLLSMAAVNEFSRELLQV